MKNMKMSITTIEETYDKVYHEEYCPMMDEVFDEWDATDPEECNNLYFEQRIDNIKTQLSNKFYHFFEWLEGDLKGDDLEYAVNHNVDYDGTEFVAL